MRSGLGLFVGIPVLSLFPSGSLNFQAIAFAAGAVIVVVAVLVFILAYAGKGVKLTCGPFHFEVGRQEDVPPPPPEDIAGPPEIREGKAELEASCSDEIQVVPISMDEEEDATGPPVQLAPWLRR